MSTWRQQFVGSGFSGTLVRGVRLQPDIHCAPTVQACLRAGAPECASASLATPVDRPRRRAVIVILFCTSVTDGMAQTISPIQDNTAQTIQVVLGWTAGLKTP